MDARLTEYDVTPAQVHVLHYLYHTGGQAPQGEVTAHLRVKPSTANGILDRMEEKELVERSVSEADARRRWITLTEKGKALQECCRQVFLETEALMVSGLSEAEQEQLFALLLRILTNLEEDRTK
jgi:DNA-binding MarR family transcriptional regulator